MTDTPFMFGTLKIKLLSLYCRSFLLLVHSFHPHLDYYLFIKKFPNVTMMRRGYNRFWKGSEREHATVQHAMAIETMPIDYEFT